MSADPADTLASVLEHAAERLDVRPPTEHQANRYSARGARIAFWRPEHDEVGITGNRALMYELTVVDSEGRLRFGVHDLRTVSVEQLLESARRGVIDGDPLRPYLIVEVGYGDAPPIDWPTFRAAWDVAREVIQVVADVGGAAAILKLSLDALRERIRRGRESLETNWTEWSQRSQRPDQFESLMRQRAWTVEELAELLGCGNDAAESILRAFGLEPDDDGRWHSSSSDPVADAMRVIYEQANYAAHRYYEEWEETFRERLTEYLTTGRNPGYTSAEGGEHDEEVLGVGRARYELFGERRLWLRSFCRSSRLLTGEELVEAAEACGLRLRNGDDPCVSLPTAADAPLTIDGPSLTGDSLFTHERDELVNALLLADEPERIETLRRLLDARFAVAIGLPPSAEESDQKAAAEFMAAVAERFDGILQIDGLGFFYDGRFRLELVHY